MLLPSAVRPVSATLYFLPIQNRLPLKFGTETVTSVTCARALLEVEGKDGRRARGWGETPLSVQWVWPSSLPYEERHGAMKELAIDLARCWAAFGERGDPIQVGHAFQEGPLLEAWNAINARRSGREAMPWLAALVASSPFDLALHDAFGRFHDLPIYSMYDRRFLGDDLSRYLEPAVGAEIDFRGKYPADFLRSPRPDRLPAWHLVGGKDLIDAEELATASAELAPRDGYPVLLRDWIHRDGLRCLKVKLRGNDAAWDLERLEKVGRIAIEGGCDRLSADFNCTVREPAYVDAILDRLAADQPRIFAMLLYVEQPFPYDLEAYPIDVRSCAARKPLFLDESAHDWRVVRRGRELGWSGVALKTCKTQTGALLSLAWARAHGMSLMVQDLTNPMLAQIPHLLLAAHAGTIHGVETNSMQFYPEASRPEAEIHPGLYRRREGCVDLRTIRGPGFGYRESEVKRVLPEPAARF